MYKLANGWTKEKVMEQIKKYNRGTKSTNRYGSCVYRSDDGNRCAIGCFIPEDHPGLQTIAGSSWLLEEHPDLKKLMPFTYWKALERFQETHDLATEHGVYSAIESFLNKEVE